MRRLCLALIAVLYVLSIPWYRDEADPVSVVFGLPDWVAVALGCYAASAVLNALAWWKTPIEDVPPAAGDER